jgi:hypothetical protein
MSKRWKVRKANAKKREKSNAILERFLENVADAITKLEKHQRSVAEGDKGT